MSLISEWRDPHDYDTPAKIVNARARASDPDTSHQAAASVGKGVEHAILAAFQFKSFTDDELADYLPTIHDATVKTARSRLKNHGFLEDSGERRLSHRGRSQIVWRLVWRES